MSDKILVDRDLFKILIDGCLFASCMEKNKTFEPILFRYVACAANIVLNVSQSETVVDKAQEPEVCECKFQRLAWVHHGINNFLNFVCVRCKNTVEKHQQEFIRQDEIKKIEAEAERLCNIYWSHGHIGQCDAWQRLGESIKNTWRVMAKDVLERQKG